MNGKEYVIGETNLTELARSKGAKESVVVSVRMDTEDYIALDKLANREGKTVSQIVREAVSASVVANEARQHGNYAQVVMAGSDTAPTTFGTAHPINTTMGQGATNKDVALAS